MNYTFHLLERLRERKIYPAGVLDIGAHFGETADVVKIVFPSANLKLFEGNPYCEFTLKMRGYDCQMCLLGSGKDETATFFVNPDDLTSTGCSIYLEQSKCFALPEQITLPIHRLDDVIPENQRASYDFIKMDVQGAELDVLEGATEILKGIRFVFMEVSFQTYNKGAPLFAEVVGYMNKKNFVAVDMCDISWDKNTLSQCNVLFEKSP